MFGQIQRQTEGHRNSAMASMIDVPFVIKTHAEHSVITNIISQMLNDATDRLLQQNAVRDHSSKIGEEGARAMLSSYGAEGAKREAAIKG